MSKIDPSLYLHNQPQTRTPSPELGKDAFMRILMTQLQHQDPLNPMDDREFISQMASFSTLEQMMQMTSAMNTLVESQLISPVIQYGHMIGKTVSYERYDDETGEKTSIETSEVIAVSQKDGWAILELENGDQVYADSILEIRNPSADEASEEGR